MSTLYKLPEDGSWIDLNQIQALIVIKSDQSLCDGETPAQKGPILAITFLNQRRAEVFFDSDADLQAYTDALAAEINKRRGITPYQQAQVARFALGDIIEILEPLTSANPHVKERLQTALKIARQALSGESSNG